MEQRILIEGALEQLETEALAEKESRRAKLMDEKKRRAVVAEAPGAWRGGIGSS